MMNHVKKSFMSMFKMVDPNQKYLPTKIATFYYMIGGALIYHPIKNLIGDIDMRFSHGICITSGRGKDAIKNVAYVTADALDMKYSEFTSLHEEQLIGKRWEDKKTGKIKEIHGYFGDNFVEKDDGLIFIKEGIFPHEFNRFLIERTFHVILHKAHEVAPVHMRLNTHDPVYKYVYPNFFFPLSNAKRPRQGAVSSYTSGETFRLLTWALCP